MSGYRPTVVALVLNGPGRVGRKFIELVYQKSRMIRERTGYLPVLCAIKSRRAILFSEDGLSMDQIQKWLNVSVRSSGNNENLDYHGSETLNVGNNVKLLAPEKYEMMLENIAKMGPGVVVEATPTDIWTGEPGLSHITKAMEHGFSVISLSKGPLVVAFEQLSRLAKENNLGFKYSGAVAAALPTLDTALYSMAGADITEIEGVLNGTTNFILNHMAKGESYEEALAQARRMGVAEANPVLDVEGFDSAAKLLIIANTIWKENFTLSDVKREGISRLCPKEVKAFYDGQTPVRLIARAVKRTEDDEKSWELCVKPEPVAPEHPFRFLPGTSKAVKFSSKEMGQIIVSGGASDVLGAAASCIKDLIHLLEERRILDR